jgi:hypothetical protein
MGAGCGKSPLAGTMIAPFNTAGLNVRFTPKTGHWSSLSGWPLCAKSGHFALRQSRTYSITSSAVI